MRDDPKRKIERVIESFTKYKEGTKPEGKGKEQGESGKETGQGKEQPKQ